MKLFAEILLFIRNLPKMVMAALLGVVLVSLFLLFVYSYSNSGPEIREKVEALGERVFGEAPELPVAVPTPGEPSGSAGEGPPPEDTSGGDPSGGVIRPMEDPSESAWISSVPSALDSDQLASLNVERPYAPYEYDREAFGPSWEDVDHNGCDTRNDILDRDLHDVTTEDNGCVVLSGVYGDPYSGQIVEFDKGGNSQDIHIEHVVALEDAWDSGAWKWTEEKRLAFANDPMVLAVVDGSANQAKGSDSISEWMPPYEGAHCAYGAQYLEIVSTYDLSVSQEDFRALSQLHTQCG